MLEWLIAFLTAVIVGHSPAFSVDFSTAPDGPPAGFTLYPHHPYAGLVVRDGALQLEGDGPPPALAAGYAQMDMGGPVDRIGMDFRFPAASNLHGAVALPVWTEPFSSTRLEHPPRVPDAPVHVVVSQVDWMYQVYDGGHTVTLAAGTFDPPLPADVPLTVDVRLHGDTAVLELPYNATVRVTDPRIAERARFATFEAFLMTPVAMSHPLITWVWADTT